MATGGNGAEAAMRSYNCANRNTARVIASETLASANVQFAFRALLEANGLSANKLRMIHASHLAKFASASPSEQALSLKAVDMGYRLAGSYRAARERIVADIARDEFAGWTTEELGTFAQTGAWPARLREADARPTVFPAAAEPVFAAPGTRTRELPRRGVNSWPDADPIPDRDAEDDDRDRAAGVTTAPPPPAATRARSPAGCSSRGTARPTDSATWSGTSPASS